LVGLLVGVYGDHHPYARVEDNFYDQLAQAVAQLTLTSFHPFVAKELAKVFGAFGDDEAVTSAIKAAQR